MNYFILCPTEAAAIDAYAVWSQSMMGSEKLNVMWPRDGKICGRHFIDNDVVLVYGCLGRYGRHRWTKKGAQDILARLEPCGLPQQVLQELRGAPMTRTEHERMIQGLD